MKPKKLPYKKFLESFKYVPRPAVNLLIERKVSDTLQILLTRRKKPPFAGSWHLPGSFVLKGEALMDCVNRVAKEELGIKVKGVELAGDFDDINGDPRGHVVDLVYRCKIRSRIRSRVSWRSQETLGKIEAVGDTAEVRFFKKLPKNIGFNHRDTLKKLGYK